mmetsp:Transcript_31779/g.62985  ORF Transcript_31779/g.62985 Transcript_31779/m.62985 type:complete len:87 (+) Transcript_31779:1163-1423(+)
MCVASCRDLECWLSFQIHGQFHPTKCKMHGQGQPQWVFLQREIICEGYKAPGAHKNLGDILPNQLQHSISRGLDVIWNFIIFHCCR